MESLLLVLLVLLLLVELCTLIEASISVVMRGVALGSLVLDFAGGFFALGLLLLL